MVGRPGQYQFSFNAGELAPAVWGNTGLKEFFAGAAQMVNCEPVPQGGFRLLPRLRYRAPVPLIYDTSTGNPAVRVFNFTYRRGTATYVVVLTPTLATIFKKGVQVGQVTTPYLAADLAEIKRVQRFDTMLLYHSAYPTGRILRGGDDVTWSFDYPAFSNVPNVQLDGVYVDTPEIWEIALTWPSTFNATGVGYILSVNGQETDQLLINTNSVADIAAFLQAVPTVAPGITLTKTKDTSTGQQFELTFTGASNAGANFIVSGRVVNNTSVALVTWRRKIGLPGGEPLTSSARGYAAAADFYQDRLVQGGFAAKPSAFGFSRTGEYFDSNIRITAAPEGGLLLNLDTDGSEEIVEIVESKHLVIFTTEADYYVADRTIDATKAPNLVQSDTHGCSRRAGVVKQEAAVLYVNRDETIVFAAAYDAVNEAYVSSPLSLLSSHLIFDTRDSALQKSFVATDTQRYWLVRDDGVSVVGSLIRSQDVTGFVQYVTDGDIQAVCVDGDNVPTMVVSRVVNGNQTILSLETVEEGLWLDSAVDVVNAVPSTAIGGLGMHEGATVWAVNDGFVEGPFTVQGGAITLQTPGTQVTVGRWTPPVADTLPLIRAAGDRTVLKRPARVHTVVLDLVNTTSLAIGANGKPPRDVPLVTTAQPTDTPIMPVTKELKVNGLTGWSPTGQVRITQLRPGALAVRDLAVEAQV